MKYVVVIPVKNEEETIEKVLLSVINQSVPCLKCLVIDNGSTDKTAEHILNLKKKYPTIEYYFFDNKSAYVLGSHIVRLFLLGKKVLDNQNVDYDYIIKLDADIEFESDFMAKIQEKLKSDEKYGIVSGTPYYYQNNRKIFEYSPIWHSHGQFKIYNRKCFDEICGIKEMLGWDCADNIQAIEKGWKTEAFRDIYYSMFRKVGGKTSLLKGRIKHGIGAYNLGYSPLYLIIKLFHDLFKPPFLLGSIYYFYGYLKRMFLGTPHILTKNQRKLLRKYFWSSFFERLNKRNFIVFQIFKSSAS